MINERPAIIIVAYNRFHSFCRLLHAVSQIRTTHMDIPLVISIDFHEKNKDIIEFAENFNWNFGSKEIFTHQKKLGLKGHILKCGDLTQIYGSVIILEDDLLVSPYFYEYTLHANEFYKNEPQVAGISLYAYERTESSNVSFKPLHDGYDTYFMQFPSSWGQCWSLKQWADFKLWMKENQNIEVFNKQLPSFIEAWPETSWKKIFAAYLIDNQKYVVFPKIGLSSNFGEVGQHHIVQLNIRQVDLLSVPINFRFADFEACYARYDCAFELEYSELLKLNPQLKKWPKFDIDFYCQKKHNANDVILTSANASEVITSFAGNLMPLINNVIFNIEGRALVLAKFKDIELKSVGKYRSKLLEEFKFLIKEILRLFYYKLKKK